MFYADCKQDEFAARMFNFKKEGNFLDIGSAHAMYSNNTFFFSQQGWKGICVEFNSTYNNSYSDRKVKYLNEDAILIDYKKIFEETYDSKFIDYLSLDIDQLSTVVLEKLPFDEYEFGVITIEHDFYLYGDTFKSKQIEILNKKGYYLVCENVYVEMHGHRDLVSAFEDWWVNPKYFEQSLLDKIKSKNELPSSIMQKFN
jgi:hypothetical protein